MAEFSNGLICGRFQTFHIGHIKLINSALQLCSRVLILIGSADKSETERNPFSIELRTAILRTVYKGNDRVIIGTIKDLHDSEDIMTGWGRYLLNTAKNFLGVEPDLMVYGNDPTRNQWFEADDIKNISEFIVKRDGISATMLRDYMLNGDYDEWCKYTPSSIWHFYDLMFKELIKAKHNSLKTDYFLSKENCYNRLKEEYKQHRKLILAVDFDDTIYDLHNRNCGNKNVLDLLREWNDYAEIIIFTARKEESYGLIKDVLRKEGIKYKGINIDSSSSCNGERKIYANAFIDDRAGLPMVYDILLELIAEIKIGEI